MNLNLKCQKEKKNKEENLQDSYRGVPNKKVLPTKGKISKFCSTKDPIKKMKRQTTSWEKNICKP